MSEAERRRYAFVPAEHESDLAAILEAVHALDEVRPSSVDRILRRHPKNGSSIFSRSELIAGYRHLAPRRGWSPERDGVIEKLRMKPIRSLSGVTPVTLLTKPHPCPGKCVFCPNDVKMPKSYLSREPGAQRAGAHRFDPYAQTRSRLQALYRIGHPVDKIELIVLGGTWSSYPESYQVWFLTRVFDALNDFDGDAAEMEAPASERIAWESLAEEVDGRVGGNPYNRIVREFSRLRDPDGALAKGESASWSELEAAHRRNETARARAVGLSLETRPDHVTVEEVRRLRRLGATKIQLGYQSLSDEILRANQRGHDVAASRRATKLLRGAGFKIQAHWMANLYRSTPEADAADFARLFDDPDFRPDELKLYPCSLVETAELMTHYESGRYRPYEEDELLELLVECMGRAPVYCRLSRVIRDIPGDDILAGSRVTNFRAVAAEEMARRGVACRDIRAREVRGSVPGLDELTLRSEPYRTSVGDEIFLSFVTGDDRLAAFVRLCLPDAPAALDELQGAALIREVHVYGAALDIGERREGRAQHRGLGRRLIERASELARSRGYPSVAVISSVGTREYYRQLGFRDGELYQHLALDTDGAETSRDRAGAILR